MVHQKLAMYRIRCICRLMFGIVFVPTVVIAEDGGEIIEQIIELPLVQFDVEPQFLLSGIRAPGDQRTIWQKAIDAEIKEIDSVCQLSKAQLKKLKIAGKGVLSRALPKTKSSTKVITFQSGSKLLEHPIWKKAVDKALTADQKKALQKHRAQQKALQRKLSVSEYVAQMDHHLGLNSDQRKRLVVLVDKTLGDSFEKQQRQNPYLLPLRQVRNPQPLPHHELLSILTLEQLQKWMQTFELVDRFAAFGIEAPIALQGFQDKPMLGIRLLQEEAGVAIHSVIPNSPADKSGILAGDVIVQVDGEKIEEMKHVTEHVGQKNPGDPVVLKLNRDGKAMEITAKLELGKNVLAGE